MKFGKKNILLILIFVILLASQTMVLTSRPAQAGSITEGMLNTINQSGINLTPSSERSPEEMVGTLIKVFLSVLGVIFIILTIYGGYIWMRSAGNEEDIKKAKNILVAAFLGLVIILAAYAITSFIISGLTETVLIE